MGNTNGQARDFDVARGGARVDDDPFAELADIFESELQFGDAASRGSAKSQPHQAPRNVDDDRFASMDEDLAAAFDAESRGLRAAPTRVPQYQTSYASQAKPKVSVATPARKSAAARPTHLTDEEIDGELENVLRNLSAPAKPRGRIVVETQSFAPDRIAEETIASAPHGEVDEFEELIRSELAAIRPSQPMRMAERGHQAPAPQQFVEDDYQVEDRYVPARSRDRGLKRALFAGGSIAALLLVGGVGFAFWQNGAASSGSSDQAFLIKADAEPYKLVPKDPGGRAYPNQNKAVYDRVAGANASTPMQQALLRNSEEPVNLPPEDAETDYSDNLPGVEIGDPVEEAGKDQTRVTAATEDEATGESVLQPRKVRTMTVGADGKLMMAEASPPAALPVPAMTANPSPLETTVKSAQKPVVQHVETPVPVPHPDPIQVAAVKPVTEPAPVPAIAAAMPAGGFFVQVSSQPSEAAAQQSMKSFGSKYDGVVAGRPVGIQSADIAGKGTYWRVRVAAETRDEANGICSKLKSAGATCFVTR